MVALCSLVLQLEPLFSPSFFLLGLFTNHLTADAGKSGSEREFKDLVIHLKKIIKSDQVQSIHQRFKFSRCGLIIGKCCSNESVKKPELSS